MFKKITLIVLLLLLPFSFIRAQTELVTNGDFYDGSSWAFAQATTPQTSTGPIYVDLPSRTLINYADNNGNYFPSLNNNILAVNTTPFTLMNGANYSFSIDMYQIRVNFAASFSWVIIDATGNIVRTLGNYTTRTGSGTGTEIAQGTFTNYSQNFTWSGTTGSNYRLAMTWVQYQNGAAASGFAAGFGRVDDVFYDNVKVTCTAAIPTITTQPITTQTVNLNATATTLSVTASPATNYQWFVNDAENNFGGTPITAATNSTYTPPTNVAGTLYYYVVVYNSCSTRISALSQVNVITDSDGDGILDNADNDDDNDGITDVNEGFCILDPALIATPSYPTTVNFDSNLLPTGTTSVRINPTGGGTDRTDLSIELGWIGQTQVRYNGANNYYNATNLADNSANFTALVLKFGGVVYASQAGPGSLYKNISLSNVFGTGTATDPWRVRSVFYIDVNNNNVFDAATEVRVSAVYSYVDNEKFFRRDFQIEVGASVPQPVEVYEYRDAYFGGATDAGYGFYASNGLNLQPGTATPTDINFIGISSSASITGGLFMGFIEISPFKSWMAQSWSAPFALSINIDSAAGTLTRTIDQYNVDIGFTIQHQTITNAGNHIFSGFTIVGDKSTACGNNRDTDGDGIPDYLDLDSDNDGCPDAIEGGANFNPTQLVNSSMNGGNTTATSGYYFQAIIKNLGNTVNTTVGSASYGIPTIAGTGQNVGDSTNANVSSQCACYKTGTIDNTKTFPTQHGITSLGRAGADNSNWPMVRQSGWTVLESKTKGFVINRIKTTIEVNSIANPVEGMMVFDVEANCLKLYTSRDNGVSFGWYCLTNQACPDKY